MTEKPTNIGDFINFLLSVILLSAGVYVLTCPGYALCVAGAIFFVERIFGFVKSIIPRGGNGTAD